MTFCGKSPPVYYLYSCLHLKQSKKEEAMKRINTIILMLAFLSPLILVSQGYARPPKPGPQFFWTAPYVTPAGVTVPGHWRYTGPEVTHKVWVPGHCAKWVPGHWKTVKPVSGRVWIRGHYDNQGHWKPGYWKKARKNRVWIRGYYDKHGKWQPGRWKKSKTIKKGTPGPKKPEPGHAGQGQRKKNTYQQKQHQGHSGQQHQQTGNYQQQQYDGEGQHQGDNSGNRKAGQGPGQHEQQQENGYLKPVDTKR